MDSSRRHHFCNESSLQLERHSRQRRQMDQDRMLAAHPLPIFSLDTAVVANVAPAIRFGVGVDDFMVETELRRYSS
jgi:hypothetical protein